MRPTRCLVLSLALLAALVLPVRAAPRTIPAPAAPGDRIAPGTMVTTHLPVLPPGVEECELLLVPEGGPAVRVSAETYSGAREIHWRMPAVAARGARLVLRAGGGTVECQSAPSAPFALAALPAGELSRILGGRSEAGTRIESFAGSAGAGLRAAPDAPSLSAGTTPACAVESSQAPLAAPGENAVAREAATLRDARPASTRRLRSNAPTFTPLRN